MARTSSTWIDSAAAPNLRRNWLGRCALVMLMAAVLPLAIDGFNVCYANWMAMQNKYCPVQTPAFDAVLQCKHELARLLWQVIGPLIRDPPWQAGTTIVLAFVWALVAAWIMRWKHH